MTRCRPAVIVLLSCALAGAGCGASEPPPPPPIEQTVFGDTVSTLDRARAVEDVTQQHKQSLDQALERAEGSREPAP